MLIILGLIIRVGAEYQHVLGKVLKTVEQSHFAFSRRNASLVDRCFCFIVLFLI